MFDEPKTITDIVVFHEFENQNATPTTIESNTKNSSRKRERPST